jgi:hypothetical protein
LADASVIAVLSRNPALHFDDFSPSLFCETNLSQSSCELNRKERKLVSEGKEGKEGILLHLGVGRFYFLHIPKTAGSSITEWLTQCVGSAATCPAKNWDQLVELAECGIENYRLFAGHFGWGLDEILGRPLRTFTVFRDPLERTISHYRHVHRDKDHPRHNAVRHQTFGEFVADVENKPMIENFQARYLVKNVVDPMRLVRCLDRDMTKRNRLSTASEECRYLFDKSYVREMSVRHLDSLEVVGITSEVDKFLASIASKFRFLDAPPIAPKSNVAPPWAGSVIIDDNSRDIVSALTEIDADLYERARVLSQPSEQN